MSMLRPAPQPISEVCLSIDVGSINAGICLFDGAPAAQQILWLEKRQLLDEHAKVMHDYEAVKRHLDAIKYQMETIATGRPYWVLVEQQFFDSESKAGLVFTLQLESAVAMCGAHQTDVRLIPATKRFPFLGIDGWAKDTRYQRKKRVVAKVKGLLDSTALGNRFGSRRHNLEAGLGFQTAPSTTWQTRSHNVYTTSSTTIATYRRSVSALWHQQATPKCCWQQQLHQPPAQLLKRAQAVSGSQLRASLQ